MDMVLEVTNTAVRIAGTGVLALTPGIAVWLVIAGIAEALRRMGSGLPNPPKLGMTGSSNI